MAANANTTQGNRPISVKFPFPIRTNSITDEYIVSGDVAGVGVSGQVYRIQSRKSGKTYALKILTDSDLSRREVILHTKACEDCEYIVKILHVYKNMFLKRKSILIVMEYMEGGELFNRITSRSTHGYTERDAARLIAMIVQAVTHLHSMDIAHRDLKLENLLFATKEDDSILKLTDFGFAKEGNNEDLPYKTPCFTPYYVAPEVISKTRYDKACDIWSMGVILYILLCGFPPFYSKHDNTCLSDDMARKIKAGDYQFDQNEWGSISDEAKSTIQQMLKVNPAERITIDKIRDCSWLTGLTSDRPINLNLLQDVDTRNQIESEFTNANNLQRRLDQDGSDGVMTVRGPEASRIAKKRAAHKRRLEVGQERTTTE